METKALRKFNGMDHFEGAFQTQISRLESLWLEQGLYQPDTSLGPDWALNKLSPVLNLLKEMADREKEARDELSLEIDDLRLEVESLCQILGRVPDDYLGQEFGMPFLVHGKLKETVALLKEEVENRTKRANDTIKAISDISFELKIKSKHFEKQDFWSYVGTVTLGPLLHSHDQLILQQKKHVELFDIAVSRIHFKWKSLSLEPEKKDAIEGQLDTLFNDPPPIRSISIYPDIDPFPHDIQLRSWYANMPTGLSALNLSMDILSILLEKARMNNGSGNKPLHRVDLLKRLRRLYCLADMDSISLKQAVGNPELAPLRKVKTHCDEMEAYVLEHAQELLGLHVGKLQEMWALCHVANETMTMFHADLEELPSYLERLQAVYDEHVHLKFQFDNAPDIFTKIRRRKYIIDKLREFEANHSSKDRFKGSSILLLKEEKFRKTEYPQLVELENSLLVLVNAYEARLGQPFIYEGGKFKLILSKSIERRKGNLEIIGLKDSMATESFSKRSKPKPKDLDLCSFCQAQSRRNSASSRAASRAASRAPSRCTLSRGPLSKDPSPPSTAGSDHFPCTCGRGLKSPSHGDKSGAVSPPAHLSRSPILSPTRTRLTAHYSTSPPSPNKVIHINRHSVGNLNSISSCLTPALPKKSATAQERSKPKELRNTTPLANKFDPSRAPTKKPAFAPVKISKTPAAVPSSGL